MVVAITRGGRSIFGDKAEEVLVSRACYDVGLGCAAKKVRKAVMVEERLYC